MSRVKFVKQFSCKLMHLMSSFHEEYLSKYLEMIIEFALSVQSSDELWAGRIVYLMYWNSNTLFNEVLYCHFPEFMFMIIFHPLYKLLDSLLRSHILNWLTIVCKLKSGVTAILCHPFILYLWNDTLYFLLHFYIIIVSRTSKLILLFIRCPLFWAFGRSETRVKHLYLR